jgi:hypothetical protein
MKKSLTLPFYPNPFMPHKLFVSAYKSGPLGYLISIRKALGVLLTNKMLDSRLQLFVLKWAAALLVIVGAGFFGFSLVPMFLAVGIVIQSACLFALLLWLATGDMFLKFALEDERFYNLATKSHALSVFEDTEFSLPQPTN